MRNAEAVSIIGGADGPTSIFIAGKGHKDKNIIRRIKNSCRSWKFRRSREKARKRIAPGTHTIQETVQYMKKRYRAVEAGPEYRDYDERRRQLKFSLLYRERPELFEADKRPQMEENVDYNDKEALHEWLDKMNMWTNRCMKLADSVTKEEYSFRYHLYIVKCGRDGEIDIEIEEQHGIMGVSSNGNMKAIHRITKDIYRYYGVTRKDIDEQSERYMMVLSGLTD